MPQISGLFAGQEAGEWRSAPVPPELQYSRPSKSGRADGPNKAAEEPRDQERTACGYSDTFERVRYEGSVSRHSRRAPSESRCIARAVHIERERSV